MNENENVNVIPEVVHLREHFELKSAPGAE